MGVCQHGICPAGPRQCNTPMATYWGERGFESRTSGGQTMAQNKSHSK